MTRFNWPSSYGEQIFHERYAKDRYESWPMLADRVVDGVTLSDDQFPHDLMSRAERDELKDYVRKFYSIPAGRYLANAGARVARYWGNCYCLRAEEDTREEWASLTERVMLCLMTGGGTGVNYSLLRPSGQRLFRTGGISSGPIPLIAGHNDMSRHIKQGGNRRAAHWAGLEADHEDAEDFITAKDWSDELKALKEKDPEFPLPFDQTNMSLIWNERNLDPLLPNKLWDRAVEQMCRTGEPGFAFNFRRDDDLRNACTEFTSAHDSNVCNLASVNMGAIDSIDEFRSVVGLTTKFLVCGSLRADVPYSKVASTRKKDRRIGLGIMGLHEWLLKRGYHYAYNEELKEWMDVYRTESTVAAEEHASRFYLPPLKAHRAIAPTGTTAILAGTTSGIEPLYAVAYRRRHVGENNRWKEQVVVEAVAERLIEEYGLEPDEIETAFSIAEEEGGFERRVRMLHELQKDVDMGISSTINLQSWGSDSNNPDRAKHFARVLRGLCTGLRGITVYPNGSRGGQPLTPIPYAEATGKRDKVTTATEDNCISGVCNV